MSEYQYDEFPAIDRPFNEQERGHVGSLSRRVELTPTRAVCIYSDGDFPDDPMDVLEKYFDAIPYLANWGTMQLAFRFPRAIVEVETLAP